MTQPPTDRSEFDNWMNQYVEASAKVDGRGFKVAQGPSITDLINKERLFAAGDYSVGLGNALIVIAIANDTGKKPFYALTKAIAAEKNSEVRRGLETAFFIFKTPYKWIAGERI